MEPDCVRMTLLFGYKVTNTHYSKIVRNMSFRYCFWKVKIILHQYYKNINFSNYYSLWIDTPNPGKTLSFVTSLLVSNLGGLPIELTFLLDTWVQAERLLKCILGSAEPKIRSVGQFLQIPDTDQDMREAREKLHEPAVWLASVFVEVIESSRCCWSGGQINYMYIVLWEWTAAAYLIPIANLITVW